MRYSISCCGMIAMKREVAAKWQVFRGANVKLGNWRQVTVRNNIYENGSRNNRESETEEDEREQMEREGRSLFDTPGEVYSHRLSY